RWRSFAKRGWRTRIGPAASPGSRHPDTGVLVAVLAPDDPAVADREADRDVLGVGHDPPAAGRDVEYAHLLVQAVGDEVPVQQQAAERLRSGEDARAVARGDVVELEPSQPVVLDQDDRAGRCQGDRADDPLRAEGAD